VFLRAPHKSALSGLTPPGDKCPSAVPRRFAGQPVRSRVVSAVIDAS